MSNVFFGVGTFFGKKKIVNSLFGGLLGWSGFVWENFKRKNLLGL
jgi:hypothetical protein